MLSLVEPPVRTPRRRRDAPLAGVPYMLKDTWDTAGIRTTGGSRRHRARIPVTSAPAYTALLKAGAVLLGKSNIGDMAFSAESDNYLIGSTNNPVDVTRTSGGSTGGGAAAVATRDGRVRVGRPTSAGSIRIPAAFCGVVGLRLSAAPGPSRQRTSPACRRVFSLASGWGRSRAHVATCRRVLGAVPSLRREGAPAPRMQTDRAVIYGPGRLLARAWPSFAADARTALTRAGVSTDEPDGLPSPTEAAQAFDGYLCAHFHDLVGDEELSVAEGIVAATLGTFTRGRLDKRLHPKGAALFALVAFGRLTLFRDPARAAARVAKVRAAFRRVWERGTWSCPRRPRFRRRGTARPRSTSGCSPS